MAPMDISQFNALLHSRESHTQLMAALSDLTAINDIRVFTNTLSPTAFWVGWH